MGTYGTAGAGAEEIARRAADKEARLEEELAGLRQWRANWQAGAEGERAVAAVLDGLALQGWRVLHDVHWPGRPQANLDHVAAGPGGIVIVDAKNWSGAIAVREGVLRQNGYRRDRVSESAAAAAASVTALLEPRHRAVVGSAVCFVQQDLPPTRLTSGSIAVGLNQLVPWLTSGPPVLSASDITLIHGFLARELTGVRSPRLQTTAQLAHVTAPAVHEPSAAARRRSGPAQTSPARPVSRSTQPQQPRRSSQAESQRRSGKQGVVGQLVKLAFVIFAVMIFLGMLQSLATGTAPRGTTPSVPTVPPAVTEPAVPTTS